MRPSAEAADSGYGKPAMGRFPLRSSSGAPVAVMIEARIGLSACSTASTARRIAPATSCAPATTGGTKSTMTASSRGSASTSGRTAS